MVSSLNNLPLKLMTLVTFKCMGQKLKKKKMFWDAFRGELPSDLGVGLLMVL